MDIEKSLILPIPTTNKRTGATRQGRNEMNAQEFNKIYNIRKMNAELGRDETARYKRLSVYGSSKLTSFNNEHLATLTDAGLVTVDNRGPGWYLEVFSTPKKDCSYYTKAYAEWLAQDDQLEADRKAEIAQHDSVDCRAIYKKYADMRQPFA